MDVGTYIRGIIDKASGKSSTPDYTETMEKINEITGNGSRLPEKESIATPAPYERMEYDAPTDEDIETSAKSGLESYRAQSVEGIENEIKALLDKYSSDKESKSDAYRKTIKSLTDAYESAKESASADALKRGLARSSIALGVTAELEKSKASATTAASKEYEAEMSALDEQISSLEVKRQKALDDFNIAYTARLTEEIDKLKTKREEKMAEVIKYNNTLAEKERDDEIARKKAESDIYTEALEQKKAENKLLDNPSDYDLNKEYAQIYELLREKLASLDAQTAQTEIKDNPIFRNYLSDEYYYRLYDEFGR